MLQMPLSKVESQSMNLKDIKVLTIDTESDVVGETPNPWSDKLILIGYRYNETGPVEYVNWDRGERPSELFMEVCKSPHILKRAHNCKYDLLVLRANDIDTVAPYDDTRILAYLEDPFQEVGLKKLVKTKLHASAETFDEVRTILVPSKSKSKKDTGKMVEKKLQTSEVDRPKLCEYNAADVTNCDKIRTLSYADQWYKKVEQPLIDVIFRMEVEGMGVNVPYLKELGEEYEKEIKTLEASFSFNPRSPKQVKEYLKASGLDSSDTSKHTLKLLNWSSKLDLQQRDFFKRFLRYREIHKLYCTYIEPITRQTDDKGRLHGSFNQAGSDKSAGGTKTGRLTSNGPNLQNIPSRSVEGKRIRNAFCGSVGQHLFISDLAQIEPRFVAHFSQSPKLIKAYKEKIDTHGMFGSLIFEKPIDQLTKMERFIGKTSWLATVYGCSAKKLKFIVELNSDEAINLDEAYFQKIQDKFIQTNPEIWNWRTEHINRTRALGYVKTFGGRTIKIPNLHSNNKWDRLGAERMAVNYLIQGSAADTIKIILVELDKELVLTGRGIITAQVHDELVGEIKDPQDLDLIHNVMTRTVHLKNVDIEAETKLVKNWSEK